VATSVLELHGVLKHYGGNLGVGPIDFAVQQGEFLTLLGPSGCGKTTTLQIVAGLLQPDQGRVLMANRDITGLDPQHRDMGLVFQNYALFPHKTVLDNVAFGLKYRSVAKADIARRVGRALELVQLPQMADRYPNQLSGGQQQRIALARAIVVEPDVLLLDEPLSALDANLREEMRVELKKIQDQLGISTIFVTHDQSEALAMSDKIVVMNQGAIEQEGSPEEVYTRPRSEFVARFLGNSNLLDGRVTARDAGAVRIEVEGVGEIRAAVNGSDKPQAGDRVRLVMRAEKLHLSVDPNGAADATCLPGRIETVDYQGQAARYFVTVGRHSLQAINPIDSRPFAEGAEVSVAVRARDIVLLETQH
jgi:spermidine/putrescine transport system ATP-binding protein